MAPDEQAGYHRPRLDVFLSHAKHDGRAIAAEIRSGLADFSQLKTWFDEDDIRAGQEWQETIERAAGRETAALIAVVTDAYPSRYWCRREVNVARWPRYFGKESQKADDVSIWTVQPAVAVSRGGDQWTRPLSQLAQVPHIGWPLEPPPTDDDGNADADAVVRYREDVHRRIADVVDRLLLETLMASFYRRMAEILKERYSRFEGRRIALLTWVPDPWSLVHLRGKLLSVDADNAWIVAYPGYGLRNEEQEELEGLVKSIEVDRRDKSVGISLVNQEQLGIRLSRQPKIEKKSAAMVVGLSAGGVSRDVEAAGIGMKHVNEMTVRLTRRLIEAGIQVQYGGTLSSPDMPLTAELIDVAKGWDRVTQQKTRNSSVEPRTPLVNYVAWPHGEAIKPRRRARLKGICKFIDVVPEALDETSPPDNESSEYLMLGADALSEMRMQAAMKADVQVVLAGKMQGWSGWLPGIIEEVTAIRKYEKLPLIIGRFGGCAQVLADYLVDKNKGWPTVFEWADAKESNPDGYYCIADCPKAAAKFDEAIHHIRHYRDYLHDPARWKNREGLRDRLIQLMTEIRPTAIIDAVIEILSSEHPLTV